jgi:Trk K+ transport system NAD-binding subunit
LARCLIIGCGCRGRALTARLCAGGHIVRATTRDPARAGEIASAGAEPVIADPDRVGTLTGALAGVSVVVILLASATGPARRLAALHGPRLEALLGRLTDTTVRGVVYEVGGRLDGRLLAAGADRVREFATRSHVSFELLDADPERLEAWLAAAQDAVQRVLAAR